MKELASLHDRHLNRPTLDDSSDQEHAIEITTQEITQVRGAQHPPGFAGLAPKPQRGTTPALARHCPTSGSQGDCKRPRPPPGVSMCTPRLGGVGTVFWLLVDSTVD